MNATLKINEELNGIELYFTGKPDAETRKFMKANGFRFSAPKVLWWAKKSDKALKAANSLVNGVIEAVETITAPTEKKVAKKQNKLESFDLWNDTQWTELEGINKDADCKQIAKEIRTHIKKRFPMVKFSVRVPYYSKINFDIVSSPFEKDSIYLAAIRQYCTNLLNSYKYCTNYDPYGDYGSSYNFYGYVEIAYNYTQTEATEEVKEQMEKFNNDFAAFNKAEEERKEKEYQEYLAEQEIKNAEYKARKEEEKKQIENVYNSVEVNELEETEQYFVNNAEFAHLNKNATIAQYQEEVNKGEYSKETVKVTKEIHFNSLEALENFSNLLLNDFDFLTNTGGSYTDDNRINSMTDFYNMDELERSTVNWNRYGVSIYFNNELQFIVDAQGYSYARYVGLTDNATTEKEFTYTQVVEGEELEALKAQAEQLEDISTMVIEQLDIIKTWNNEHWKAYKETMKDKLKQYQFKLNKRIIQQLDTEILKVNMYKLLVEVDGIQEQFKEADLQQGEKLTMFYISDWGGIIEDRITFDSVEPCKYAQYDNAVKLQFKQQGKRGLYYKHFHSDMLVYKGHLELPNEVLNSVEVKNGMIITKGKFHSCDHKQYDEIINHFKELGQMPIVNTYKPIF